MKVKINKPRKTKDVVKLNDNLELIKRLEALEEVVFTKTKVKKTNGLNEVKK